MYVPAHFDESRTEVLHDVIEKTALGMLITHGRSGLDANHIPFDLNRTLGAHGTLQCHVARKNPVWQDVSTGDETLVVFRAADAYISPQWYPSKHETHRQVPTWNYIVVHAHGRLVIRDEERFVRGNVARLTRRHESSQPTPWKMTDAPGDYIDSMLQAIVGLEIEITRLVGKWKVGQNKDVRDIRGAGEALTAKGSSVIGEAMLAAAEVRQRQD